MATKREIFTIPENVVKELNKPAKERLIPKSKAVTKLLKDFFETQTKKDVQV